MFIFVETLLKRRVTIKPSPDPNSTIIVCKLFCDKKILWSKKKLWTWNAGKVATQRKNEIAELW